MPVLRLRAFKACSRANIIYFYTTSVDNFNKITNKYQKFPQVSVVLFNAERRKDAPNLINYLFSFFKNFGDSDYKF
jgi:hypothetical protein